MSIAHKMISPFLLAKAQIQLRKRLEKSRRNFALLLTLQKNKHVIADAEISQELLAQTISGLRLQRAKIELNNRIAQLSSLH